MPSCWYYNNNSNAYPYIQLSGMLTCMEIDRPDCDANTDGTKSGILTHNIFNTSFTDNERVISSFITLVYIVSARDCSGDLESC